MLPVLMLIAAGLTIAAAGETDPVTAQALFDQARVQMAGGDFAGACPKLEESQRLAPAPGTAFNLAECYTHIGRLASAWSLFRDVEAEEKLAQQVSRMQLARRRADELERVLPHLVIRVEDAIAGLEIRRDSVAVRAPQWGLPIPIDLGTHAITAEAPGHRPWSTSVDVRGPGELITVVVAPLEELPPAAAPPVAAMAARSSSTQMLHAPVDRTPGAASSRKTAALIALVGAVALGIGAATTIAIARSMYDDAGPCEGNVCPQLAYDQRTRARHLGDVATGLAIASGAALAGAGILWLVRMPGHSRVGLKGSGIALSVLW